MSYKAVHIACKGEWQEIIIAELSVLPFDTFEEKEDSVSAYMPAEFFKDEELKEVLAKYSEHIKLINIEDIEKKNWNEEWEKNYDPVFVDDKVLVRAIFHEPVQGFEHEIVINPKMSFGTGHHATTHLMIKMQLDIDHHQKDVADFGTGTGVLAIMARKLGARSLLLTDVDDWCIENSQENLALNEINDATYLLGAIKTLAIKQEFDVILANINKNVLLEEMEEYIKCLREGGTLLLSGFYDYDVEDLRESVENYGLSFVKNDTKNSWSALQFKK